jgi:hypothetical protein
MKSYCKPVLFLGVLFFSFAASAQQIKTWICPQSSANSLTNTIGPNQVMELLSGSFEPDSRVDIVQGDQSMFLGNGGGNLNTPFVIAGPAVITFRKTATGGQGTIISYRITTQPAH